MKTAMDGESVSTALILSNANVTKDSRETDVKSVSSCHTSRFNDDCNIMRTNWVIVFIDFY